jgi:hypothetical protein
MRKTVSLFLVAALWVILFHAPAWARPVDCGLYVANLPNGWDFSFKDKIAAFVSPEKSCLLIVTDGLSVDAHKKKVGPLVKQYAHITEANPRQNVTVTRVHGLRVVVTILGDHPDRVPVYQSIKLKDDSHAVPYR